MFNHSQQQKICFMAMFTLVLGLFSAVPHYDHETASHLNDLHQQVHMNADSDSSDTETSSGCGHGCHFGSQFSGILADAYKSVFILNSSNLTKNSLRFSSQFSSPDIRPPIS